MRFNCTSLWTPFFQIKTLQPCIFTSNIKKELRVPFYYTLTQRILSTSITRHSPAFPFFPSLPSPSANDFCPLFSPLSRHQVLLFSFFSIFPSLSVYLSVCLSVTRHFTRSLTQSESATQWESHSHSPRSLTRSLTRSRSHTGWFSFFFFIPYTVVVCM